MAAEPAARHLPGQRGVIRTQTLVAVVAAHVLEETEVGAILDVDSVVELTEQVQDEALEWTAEIYRAAGLLMARAGKLQGVADEGGYWPVFASNEEALDTLVRSIEEAGFKAGKDACISLDIAASELYRDGGRACEYFFHILNNPGDEISFWVAGKALSDPETDWHKHLSSSVEELYGTTRRGAVHVPA